MPAVTRAKGESYNASGAVVHVVGDAWKADALVRGTRPYRVKLRLAGKTITASCECPFYADRGNSCKHIWAALIEAEEHALLTGDGMPAIFRPQPATDHTAAEHADHAADFLDSDPRVETAAENARRLEKEATQSPAKWEKLLQDFATKLAREEADARAPRFADAQIVYAIDRGASLAGQRSRSI